MFKKLPITLKVKQVFVLVIISQLLEEQLILPTIIQGVMVMQIIIFFTPPFLVLKFKV